MRQFDNQYGKNRTKRTLNDFYEYIFTEFYPRAVQIRRALKYYAQTRESAGEGYNWYFLVDRKR